MAAEWSVWVKCKAEVGHRCVQAVQKLQEERERVRYGRVESALSAVSKGSRA